MSLIFIAGTDTGVGKTVVAGLLSCFLLEEGYRVVTQKWVQTGRDGSSSDIDIHLKFMHRSRKDYEKYLPFMEPYIFRFASSPHLAASLEKKRVDIVKIKGSLTNLGHFDFIVVEGSGGLLVPLNAESLLIDVIEEMSLPVLIVAGNKLGVINHTLLSIETLRSRGIEILGIVFNNISKKENRVILKDNPKIIKKFSGETVLGILPYSSNPFQLKKRFLPIGKKILNRYG